MPLYTRKKKDSRKMKTIKQQKTKQKKLDANTNKHGELVATNKEANQLLEYISKHKKIPNEVQQIISNSLPNNKMDPKLKKDIIQLVPRLKDIQTKKNYNYNLKHYSSRVFFSLPHKYRKPFLISLDRDIDLPEIRTFRFIKKYSKQIVLYIGNRNTDVHQDVARFINQYYHDPPAKVSYRDIVTKIDDYFKNQIDPLDYDNPADL